MREQVLWRKISRIVLLLSARLEISPERALNLFYETNVCAMLHDSRYGLHLMSDTYIINDVLPSKQNLFFSYRSFLNPYHSFFSFIPSLFTPR